MQTGQVEVSVCACSTGLKAACCFLSCLVGLPPSWFGVVETEPHSVCSIDQASLSITIYPKLAFDSALSCFVLPNSDISGVNHLDFVMLQTFLLWQPPTIKFYKKWL